MPYEKVGKNEPVCIADEVPFEIPESWEWVRWGTLSESIQYGYNAPAKENGRIKMVRISDIQDNNVLWPTVPYCEIDEKDIDTYLLKPNDILFARTGGTVGKSYLVKMVPEDAIYAGYLIRTRYSALLCPEFLKYFMETELYWSQLRNGTIATAQPNCNGKTLAHMLVPLPPQNEQKRIVKKLDKLIAHVVQYNHIYNYNEKLNGEFPELLKKSILQEAIQGKLVPQNPADEPAYVLLERIRAEKERLIQEGKIKRDKHESVIYRRDNSHYEKRGSDEVCIDEELPFEIPDNWEWVKLSDLTQFIGGYAYKSETFIEKSEYQILRLGNVKNDEIRYSAKPVFISKELAEKTADFRCKPNDILLTMTGTRLKRDYFYTVAVSNKDTNCFVNQRVGCLREYYPNIYKWLIWVLKSEGILSQVFKYETGTANQGNLGAENIMKTFIPLPPLNEQNRICNMIECLLKKTSAL